MGLFIYFTAYKVSKYDVSSGPYFPVFELNTQIYEINSVRIQEKTNQKKTPYLDTFHAVFIYLFTKKTLKSSSKRLFSKT